MSGAPLEREDAERGAQGFEAGLHEAGLHEADLHEPGLPEPGIVERGAPPESPALAWTSRSIHRRRASAARARRRRLLVIDAAIAVALALIAIVLAPGVAIVAIVALVVLAACGSWVLGGRLRGRRARRHARPSTRNRRRLR